MKSQKLPKLETELQNIIKGLCPAESHDGEKYSCFFTGGVCQYKVRENCEDYRVHILPRRKNE